MPTWWYIGGFTGVIPWGIIGLLYSIEAAVIGLIVQLIGVVTLTIGTLKT